MFRRPVVALAAVALIAAAIALFPAPSKVPESQHQRSDAFWGLTFLRAAEVEVFDSVGQMARSADWVVEGKIAGASPGRVVTDESGVPIGWNANVRVDVSATLVGQELKSIDLEVIFLSKAKFQDFLRQSLPTETAIFFIRNKAVAARHAGWSEPDAEREAGYNMLINMSQSVFRVFDGRIATPDGGASELTATWESQPADTLIRGIQAAVQ
jgi:hypothetical protein